ncbi:hypothetical protein TNCV_744501 [Trichonephila clavipes]|nr:hypothetical protein TNCV_744501 [Trichonephila clavipes]
MKYPQSFHIILSDMGWRLASRAICPNISPKAAALKIKSAQDILEQDFQNKIKITILLERRQIESVGRRDSRTTFLRSDWPRPFARREVGVEMDWVDPKINDPSKGDLATPTQNSATDQPQQCHSDYSGLFRRNRIQEKLRFCSHAFLPRSTNQSGHSLPGRPTHIRPHTLSRYGMEERFAFRFPVMPSIIIHDEGERILEKAWLVSPRRDVVFCTTRLRAKGPPCWILCD